MERILETINNVYQKYLPITKKQGILLDIDFPDTTITINENSSKRVERDLDKIMRSAVSRSKSGDQIKIIVRKNSITISDNGTILSPSTCKLLISDFVTVKSRVGFGTSFQIDITTRQD